MMHESADEIERLTAANAKLEQELKDARERVAQATRTNQLHWLDEYNKVNTTLAKVMTTLGETEAKLTAAESRLAALERDGERLDWLQENPPHIYWSVNGNHPEAPNGPFAVATGPGAVVYAETIRAAIDAAQQADAATGKTEGGK